MPSLRHLLRRTRYDLPRAAEHLDALSPAARLQEIRSLRPRELAALFEAAAGHRPIDLDFVVPADVAPMREVVHEGKNSLPAFTHFAKVFCRPEEGADELWGYNRSHPLVQHVVGPGYFVLRRHEVEGELLVDYLRIPPSAPSGWPPILPNEARLSRFVYAGTQDVLRGVSAHVSIGRATRGGKPMDAWFALCRTI